MKTVVGQRVWLGIRPEHIVVGAPSGSAQSLTATIERIEQLGGASFLYCSLAGGETLTVHAAGQVTHAAGAQITVHLPLVDVHVFDSAEGELALIDARTLTMQALRTATFAGRLAHSVRFDLEAGWRCEVFVLADDLIRVLFLRKDTFREPRSWTVAPGDADVPWEGRDRRDVTGFGCPAFAVAENEHEVTLTTAALSLQVDAAPFRPSLVRQRPDVRGGSRDLRLSMERAQEHRSPLHGACADRSVLRPR